MITFKEKLNTLFDDYNKLITSKNVPLEDGNGILTRYKYGSNLFAVELKKLLS